MPIGAVAIGHILSIIIFGSAFAGPIASYCRDHPGPGCVNKRDLLQQVARADVGPCNVPKYNFDLCNDQIKAQNDRGVKIWTSIPSPGVAQFDSVPPACMNLVVALSGSCTGEGPRPVPCGSACIQYHGITDDKMREISSYLRS